MPGYELIGKEELKELQNIFKTGCVFFAHGFEKRRKNIFRVRKFEYNFKKLIKSRYSLAVSSGTSALKICLKALGIKPGDEVITQPFNFIATIEAIIDCGAKPVFTKIDSSLNMCMEDLKKKITIKTKCIIPVHMLGFPCDVKKLELIKKKYNIPIIEDNCESLMSKYKKKFCGNLFEMGVFSLDFGKFITTGEGGLISTNKLKLFNYSKSFHDHGHAFLKKKKRGHDIGLFPGFNFRMTELQGAVGLAQLKKVNEILNENKKRYKILEVLSKKYQLRQLNKDTTSNYDTFIFYVESKKIREKIINFLNKTIGTKNLPDALNWHDASRWSQIFKKKEIKELKKFTKILKKSIAIPILLEKKASYYENISKKILNISK
jgi:8-amino-3,8-dideoxy-alpha-D-manno-octulosonate transaminase